jgi:GNAT superfamily N-acetyltransferase
MLKSEEVGFVVIDQEPSSADLVLYELFIVPEHRGRGMGSLVLTAVEDYAWQQRRRKVVLLPRSIDPTSYTDQKLEQWYAKRGYGLHTNGSMYKAIA